MTPRHRNSWRERSHAWSRLGRAGGELVLKVLKVLEDSPEVPLERVMAGAGGREGEGEEGVLRARDLSGAGLWRLEREARCTKQTRKQTHKGKQTDKQNQTKIINKQLYR